MNRPESIARLARGFTLLEILIALAIFAVTASALISSMTRQVSQASLLQDKTIAYWIAENELARLRLPQLDEDDLSLIHI